jgi:hypothetical protein
LGSNEARIKAWDRAEARRAAESEREREKKKKKEREEKQKGERDTNRRREAEARRAALLSTGPALGRRRLVL